VEGTRPEYSEALWYIVPRDSTAGDKTWVRGLSEAGPSHHLGTGVMSRDYWAPERVE
jgi:hypothetical protein